jgi:hypothetical protein
LPSRQRTGDAGTGRHSGPYLTIEPTCADPKSEVLVEGYNLLPNADGPLNFIPPSGVSIQLDRIETDGTGFFSAMVELRNRTSEEVQHIRAITRKSEGMPRLSQNGKDTIDKIIETVFMAFLATTIGTILAIPVSFFAARNLMSTVTSPVPSVALSIIFVPIGLWLGAQIAGLPWPDRRPCGAKSVGHSWRTATDSFC